MGLFDLFSRKKKQAELVRNLETTRDLVMMGLYERLVAKNSALHGKDVACHLAAAVANEVFARKPNELGAQFVQNNRRLIDDQLGELAKDKNACRVITLALRSLAIIPSLKGEDNGPVLLEQMDHIERLQQIGIVERGGDVPELSVLNSLAKEFYNTRPNR